MHVPQQFVIQVCNDPLQNCKKGSNGVRFAFSFDVQPFASRTPSESMPNDVRKTPKKLIEASKFFAQHP